MSVVRLIMTEGNLVASGLIPSQSITALLWAISAGADSITNLWKTVSQVDPALQEHFSSTRDILPVLEGYDDGLFVINWSHCCIESFQVYQPVRHADSVIPHNGVSLEDTQEPIEFTVPEAWNITDHHFEESRH